MRKTNMAKVTEGNPYYYAPFVANSNILYVYKRGEHPHKEVVCKPTTQEHASLIVDALNFWHDCNLDHNAKT